ncbi:MAG: hypothetical protein SPK07_08525 [Coriobacteriales bacterium]|nr:hypothetical protein [Coriobacteriales bacterium]
MLQSGNSGYIGVAFARHLSSRRPGLALHPQKREYLIAGVDIELLVEVLHVGLYGVGPDVKLAGYLSQGHALGHEQEDVLLAGGKPRLMCQLVAFDGQPVLLELVRLALCGGLEDDPHCEDETLFSDRKSAATMTSRPAIAVRSRALASGSASRGCMALPTMRPDWEVTSLTARSMANIQSAHTP